LGGNFQSAWLTNCVPSLEPIEDFLHRLLAAREGFITDDLDRMIQNHLQAPIAWRHLDDLGPGALSDRLVGAAGAQACREQAAR